MSSSSFWRDFPVKKTLVLDKLEQVKSVCDTMILDYLKLLSTNDFSYRILLPRKEDNNNLARKIGYNLQSEFTSQLRQRKIKTKMREIRYIHDKKYFGWIIINSEYTKNA
jgi:electron transfer flavoprotein alpha subunit